MRYLCLIYLDEERMDALPAADMDALNAAHLDLNDELRASGHLVEAEALQPVGTTATVRVRQGKVSVVDGPYSEAKELVAGFYFIEAQDREEAIAIAARFPSAPLGTIEVREIRKLLVPGRD